MSDGRFIAESVMREVSIDVHIYAGAARLRFQFIRRLDGKEGVLNRPVADNRCVNFRCVNVLERRETR